MFHHLRVELLYSHELEPLPDINAKHSDHSTVQVYEYTKLWSTCQHMYMVYVHDAFLERPKHPIDILHTSSPQANDFLSYYIVDKLINKSKVAGSPPPRSQEPDL